MRQTELTKIIEARAATGLENLNLALGEASRLAAAIERAPKLVIDPKSPTASMRNFTKVLDADYGRSTAAKTYALIEYVDDAQESDDER